MRRLTCLTFFASAPPAGYGWDVTNRYSHASAMDLTAQPEVPTVPNLLAVELVVTEAVRDALLLDPAYGPAALLSDEAA